jgi:hypothetical protein
MINVEFKIVKMLAFMPQRQTLWKLTIKLNLKKYKVYKELETPDNKFFDHNAL